MYTYSTKNKKELIIYIFSIFHGGDVHEYESERSLYIICTTSVYRGIGCIFFFLLDRMQSFFLF